MVYDLSAGCHERGDWSDLECLRCVYAYIRAISHVYIYIKKVFLSRVTTLVSIHSVS